MSQDRGPEPADSTHSDALVAVRNAMKLGLSLLGSWAVALGVKLVLPRYLGPEAFGTVNFAEAFAGTTFVLTSLGVDTYIRKEVPVKPAHINDFFGSLYWLRMAMNAVLLAAMAGFLIATGRSDVELRTVMWFGVGQIFYTTNLTYASVMHGMGVVNGVAILNPVSKLVWGLGIVIGFYFGRHLEVVGIAFAASEALKALVLSRLARRLQPLPLGWSFAALKPILVASLPFFLLSLSTTLSSKVDVTILAYLSDSKEVGWYGAASNVAGLALLLTPLIGWVLLPLSSRAAARSSEELVMVTRRSLELVLIVAIPVSLMLALSSDVLVALIFGDKFTPAVHALRVLSAMFVLTYVAIVATTCLMRMEKSWFVTWVTLAGIVVQILLNVVLIRPFAELIGDGGAGLGSAVSVIASEALMMTALLWQLGRAGFDARTVSRLLRTAVVVLVVLVIDRIASLYIPGIVRVVVDCIAYLGLATLTKALDVRELVGFARQALQARRGAETGDGS